MEEDAALLSEGEVTVEVGPKTELAGRRVVSSGSDQGTSEGGKLPIKAIKITKNNYISDIVVSYGGEQYQGEKHHTGDSYGDSETVSLVLSEGEVIRRVVTTHHARNGDLFSILVNTSSGRQWEHMGRDADRNDTIESVCEGGRLAYVTTCDSGSYYRTVFHWA